LSDRLLYKVQRTQYLKIKKRLSVGSVGTIALGDSCKITKSLLAFLNGEPSGIVP